MSHYKIIIYFPIWKNGIILGKRMRKFGATFPGGEKKVLKFNFNRAFKDSKSYKTILKILTVCGKNIFKIPTFCWRTDQLKNSKTLSILLEKPAFSDFFLPILKNQNCKLMDKWAKTKLIFLSSWDVDWRCWCGMTVLWIDCYGI